MSWRQGRACAQDARDKMVPALGAGQPARAAAQRFSDRVSYPSTAPMREAGVPAMSRQGRRTNTCSLRLGAHHDAILAQVQRHPDAGMATTNGRSLRAQVEPALAPALSDGNAVVFDNSSGYKVRGVRQTVEARCAAL